MKEYQNLSLNVYTCIFSRMLEQKELIFVFKCQDDHDESDEIDKFFTSPSETNWSNLFLQKTDNSTKKRRKLSSE